MGSSFDLVVAAVLFMLAVALAWFEWRRRPALGTAEGPERSYLERRLWRRMRIALLLAALAATIVGARWIDPDRRPVPYLLVWFGAALLTLWLMWLGIVDYLAARLHWIGQTSRNLVDIARTRAELRELQSRGRNGRHRD
jgi:hypothetical protein